MLSSLLLIGTRPGKEGYEPQLHYGSRDSALHRPVEIRGCKLAFLGFHSLRPPRVVGGGVVVWVVVVGKKVVVVAAVVVRAARVSRARVLAAGASGRQ